MQIMPGHLHNCSRLQLLLRVYLPFGISLQMVKVLASYPLLLQI